MFQDWGSCTDKITDSAGKVSEVASLRCVPVVFHNVVAAALMFVGLVTAFLIVTAGVQFVTSGGDPKQVEGARKTLTCAILGLVLVLCSFPIIYFIGYATGTQSCITKFGFDC